LALGAGIFAVIHIQRELTRTRMQVAADGRIPFELRTLSKLENAGFEPLAAPDSYTSGSVFHGKLYLAGPGGLAEFASLDAEPHLLRTGLDLPPVPLVRIVTGQLRGDAQPVLMLATRGGGILLYDGSALRQLLPGDVTARDVTALLPLASGDLLIGTRQLGLLLFNGKELTTFNTNLSGFTVTALAGDEGDFWIGTRDRGVFHWHAGELESFNAGSGLPDAQVESIAFGGARTYIGTPLGIAEFDHGRPVRTLAPGFFAHTLYREGDILLAGSIDAGVREISLSAPRTTHDATGESTPLHVEQFFAGDGVFAVTSGSVVRRTGAHTWQPVLTSQPSPLADRNVAALGFAPDGRLWIGYFDHGLDILSTDFQRAQHVEDDYVFCVNRIVTDPQRNTMDVATANGLVLFDASGRERQVLQRRDGLIADQVTDVAFTRDGMAVATPAGITFIGQRGMESLYAFHGLVNNHVYALASDERSGNLLAGTLGGISLLQQQTVRHNLTANNSGLKHNWITAVVALDSDWFVGTYGAGVMQLDSSGQVTAMDVATRPSEINPNAMLVTPSHVFAGSLGDGLFVYSRTSRHWTQVTAGLPSLNVTALAARAGELYVGTDNGPVRISEGSFAP
jgi:ligand-binding sensor domain-containing protein